MQSKKTVYDFSLIEMLALFVFMCFERRMNTTQQENKKLIKIQWKLFNQFNPIIYNNNNLIFFYFCLKLCKVVSK